MGIKFTCPACGRALNVKAELGGKRGRCPKCQAKIDIPTESTPWARSHAAISAGLNSEAPEVAPAAAPQVLAAEGLQSAPATLAAPSPFVAAEEQTIVLPRSPLADGTSSGFAGSPASAKSAPADPIAEAPQLQWYVTPPGATSQYGPAGGEEFRGWIREGRVTADSLVWRQDWPDWRPASIVFPELQAAAPPIATAAPAAPVPAPVPVMPPLAGMALPTALGAMPMSPGMAPMAQSAFPGPGAVPGMFPATPMAAPASDGFPIATEPPAAARGSTSRGRPYRQKSNTGPIVAIVVLLLAMIPLSFFVWKVVSEQIVSPPAAADSTASPKESDASPKESEE